MIKALFKFAKIPDLVEGRKPIVIDTTSNSGDFRELSPFILPAPPAQNLENLWQFSKVYFPEHIDADYNPNHQWYEWRQRGFNDKMAHRYPMGKGRIPRYSMWDGKHLDYIEARKQIYAVEYSSNIQWTKGYQRLMDTYAECCRTNRELILLDYDAYDHIALNMSLIEVINSPKRKMGHAFVLIMMLTDLLEECINS